MMFPSLILAAGHTTIIEPLTVVVYTPFAVYNVTPVSGALSDEFYLDAVQVYDIP